MKKIEKILLILGISGLGVAMVTTTSIIASRLKNHHEIEKQNEDIKGTFVHLYDKSPSHNVDYGWHNTMLYISWEKMDYGVDNAHFQIVATISGGSETHSNNFYYHDQNLRDQNFENVLIAAQNK